LRFAPVGWEVFAVKPLSLKLERVKQNCHPDLSAVEGPAVFADYKTFKAAVSSRSTLQR
jgi:hypothetical protein